MVYTANSIIATRAIQVNMLGMVFIIYSCTTENYIPKYVPFLVNSTGLIHIKIVF